MRKKNVLLCGVLALSMCLVTACGEEKKQEVSKEPKEDVKIETVYEDLSESPNYPEISKDVKYTTYYFDSKNGNDENDGLSAKTPLQSLDGINSLVLNAKKETPLKILIKAGSVYEGTLNASEFEAADESPLIIGIYAKSEKSPYAKIVGPENAACVTVGCSNIRISGLEVTGSTANQGFRLSPLLDGAMKNVVIAGNYCHDLNFNVSHLEGGVKGLPPVGTYPEDMVLQKICTTERYLYGNGGIIANAETPEFLGPSWFENMWIEDNVIERVARTGIWVFGSWTYRPGVDWGYNNYHSDEVNYYPHRNVVIRNNHISHAGGDSIVMGAVNDGWLEGNTAYYSQYLGRGGFYNAGIWTHSCKNIMFQNNEAAYTYKQNGAGDGQGFDIDIGCTDITFRNNYSHHNEGGGILLCNQSTWLVLYDEEGNYIRDEDGLPMREKKAYRWEKVDLRNNVFADNNGAVVQISGYVNDLFFENNTVIIPGTKDEYNIVSSQDFNGTGMPGTNWNFKNNIFVSRGGANAKFNMAFVQEYLFDTNIFWGFADAFKTDIETEHEKSVKNLLIKDPGIAKDVQAENGISAMQAFKSTNKEILTGGTALEKMNKYDAEGLETTDKQYFGAFSTAK